MRKIAWTGGSRPRKFLYICQAERELRKQFFREAMATVKAHWGDSIGLCGTVLDSARVHYRYAKYDAHATIRDVQLAQND